ncbi:copper resitance protein [Iodidimonas gelatinilytica]|uniref:Copper resitance protein n=1 Tax=Iodidimonas gelatinilytica TaxID=1236966 RepID=A0A5A7N0I0_9PROT|nr:copper resistance system multicopper oxidase [Iodidimonas gelatinilytica]GER00556.1 copper resitance protein [Iodidimonas gelatinilytica]
MITRRNLIRSATMLGGGLLMQGFIPVWAKGGPGYVPGATPRTDSRSGTHDVDLFIAETPVRIDGQHGTAVTLNGGVPGPLLRFTEGETATIRVHNRLRETTSIHWHGILLPFEMDGVPGVAFPGIKAGETFTYRYLVRQSGTYWYHSHSGLQEQLGHYGPLVIDPKEPDIMDHDREHILILSDWMFDNPYKVMAKLKKRSDYLKFQQRTMGDFFKDASETGLGAAISDRMAWGRMRMSPADIADVTGHIYSYLINGAGPDDNWTGLFQPGERLRLRIINAASMSYFNLRIPGLAMTVVAADGQPVQPVEVDEFQIAPAETYDVIVTPKDDRAYTVMAEAMDRSGYARGTLAPRSGMSAAIPALRDQPLRTMADMGMDMDAMPAGHGHGKNHGSMAMGGPIVARHGPSGHGPGSAGVAAVQRSRLGEPGTGLETIDHRVLVYTDLKARTVYNDRPPERELELHLTGNMERYMWSFDGEKFSEVDGPIPFALGERLRLILVNDTMMEHPIHLHGMWMELENGHGGLIPRKHTISVKPGERLSALIHVDAPGRWAFHCHLLYHMEAGMFRVVEVTPYDGEDA